MVENKFKTVYLTLFKNTLKIESGWEVQKQRIIPKIVREYAELWMRLRFC